MDTFLHWMFLHQPWPKQKIRLIHCLSYDWSPKHLYWITCERPRLVSWERLGNNYICWWKHNMFDILTDNITQYSMFSSHLLYLNMAKKIDLFLITLSTLIWSTYPKILETFDHFFPHWQRNVFCKVMNVIKRSIFIKNDASLAWIYKKI